ncbi:MAG: hypothetical protein WC523_00150 [Patescibacteria group bacterium]
MSRFIQVTIRERIEGTPGFVEPKEFDITINTDQITLFNAGEDGDVTFVRLSCGMTICVAMKEHKFAQLVRKER